MKYKFLLTFLKGLIYAKRVVFFVGSWSFKGLGRVFHRLGKGFAFVIYKFSYFLKRANIRQVDSWLLKRGTLQILLFTILFFVILPQTQLYAQDNNDTPGFDSLAYKILNVKEEFSVEEIVADEVYIPIEPSSWKEGAVINDMILGLEGDYSAIHERDLAGVLAGGSAISKPIIMPGAQIDTSPAFSGSRQEIVEYTVEGGDNLGLIAQKFDISLVTLLWENNLTSRSVIQPGQILRIPPVSGVVHSVKSGDTILKIANLYDASAQEIIEFNDLDDGGANIQIGQKIIVPDGVKKYYTSTSQVASSANTSQSSISVSSIPSRSSQGASTSGFVWPSAAKTITQYYTWSHHGLDIAGPWQSANYAAKAGTVTVSQCGWNSGYGCYIMIDHGGGVETLYGHNSKLLVSAGDYVDAGQTIGLMGNTGKVYGVTGIHLHFEIRINGVRVNPLGYIR